MVEIRNTTKIRVPGAFLKALAKKVLAGEKVPLRGISRRETKKRDVSVVFLGKKEAQALNKAYRKKTYVPNVLSFSIEELGLGELVLCPEIISQDARKYGITFKQELSHVFTHGLMHLLGYSHTKIEEKSKNYL